jgi:hypothetical protein
VALDSAEVDVRATFPIGDKYGVEGEAGSAMEGLSYRLELSSTARPAEVARVAELAEHFCHASQSLRVEVPVSTSIMLNGNRLDGSTL